MLHKFLWACLTLVAGAAICPASTITYGTPAGSSIAGSGPVNATAKFVFTAGTLTITITDLEADPGDVGELVSGLAFVLNNGDTTATLASSLGEQINVNGDGTFALGSTGSTGWGLNTNVGGGLQLDALGFIGPKGLIIGPPDAITGEYDSAKGSIAGNGPHNPFIDQTATFVITNPNISATTTTVNSATFSFGTTAGKNVTGLVVVPEPSAIVLVLCGGALLGILKAS